MPLRQLPPHPHPPPRSTSTARPRASSWRSTRTHGLSLSLALALALARRRAPALDRARPHSTASPHARPLLVLRLSFWISWGTSRGERYWGYNGTALFDDDLWDGKEGNSLKVMWNGPEWFHMIEEKETDNLAPGNCDSDLAPECPNGFKYRVELKLDDALEHHGYSWVRYQ